MKHEAVGNSIISSVAYGTTCLSNILKSLVREVLKYEIEEYRLGEVKGKTEKKKNNSKLWANKTYV